ncbi:MAG TPA: DUF1611 domain-containing protein [Polyangiaceae bacterium]|nr:DUF1611 domain-containing protein [Polyangiaceae bacterium]
MDNAHDVVDGANPDIIVFENFQSALEASRRADRAASALIIGLAPDGGRLPASALHDVAVALNEGLDVYNGLHDWLNDDPALASLAAQHHARIIDIRRPPDRDQLHFFSGLIKQVDSFRVAVLGTDSAVGKRTTAWAIVDAFRQANVSAQLVGTGQTAWLQGAEYGIILDSIVNDFVAGELENAVYRAWKQAHPDVIVLEGQGSLLHPAYPGGFELLAATRPHVVVVQHAPGRQTYDGFDDFPLHPIALQCQAIELISQRPVVAITLNTEQIPANDIPSICEQIEKQTGRPTMAPLVQGVDRLITLLRTHQRSWESTCHPR